MKSRAPRACAPPPARGGGFPRGAAENPLVAARRKERDRGGLSSPAPRACPFYPARRSPNRTIHHTIQQPANPHLPHSVCFAASAASCRELPSVLSVALRSFPPPPLTPFHLGRARGYVGVLSEGWRCRAPVAARTLSSGSPVVLVSLFSRSLLLTTFVISLSHSRFVDRDREILTITRDSSF